MVVYNDIDGFINIDKINLDVVDKMVTRTFNTSKAYDKMKLEFANQDNAIERVQYSFRATATAASRTAWQDCNNSFFNCVNQYLTGDLQSHAISSGSDQITYEANRAMNDAVHQVRTQYTQLRSSMSLHLLMD